MYGCTKHNGITSSGSCGQCGLEYCEDCLVFPFGPSRPAMCVGCALSFAGVRHKGAKNRVAKPKVSWSERRRRRNRPTVPTVSMPESKLEEEFDLGSFESIDTSEFIEDEAPFDASLLEIERSAPAITGPTAAEGLEALIAVPLPKRSIAVSH
jgi:hypothetical protein